MRLHSVVDLPVSEDLLLDSYIRAARVEAEKLTGEVFVTQTWELTLCGFPAGRQSILLPKKPVQSITQIAYVDTAGDDQIFGTLEGSPVAIQEYRLIADIERPLVALNLNYEWPVPAVVDHAVRIRFVAGYTDDECVPEDKKIGIALGAAFFYQNREDVVEFPQYVRNLLGVPKVG